MEGVKIENNFRMIFTLFILFPVIIRAQFTPYQVTTSTQYQIKPSISGCRIVWQDERNKTCFTINYDIYLYTLPLGSEQRITTNAQDQSHPEIWENIIVWDDLRNGEIMGIRYLHVRYVQRLFKFNYNLLGEN